MLACHSFALTYIDQTQKGRHHFTSYWTILHNSACRYTTSYTHKHMYIAHSWLAAFSVLVQPCLVFSFSLSLILLLGSLASSLSLTCSPNKLAHTTSASSIHFWLQEAKALQQHLEASPTPHHCPLQSATPRWPSGKGLTFFSLLCFVFRPFCLLHSQLNSSSTLVLYNPGNCQSGLLS